MLMYTSCGWFFDELSGIETVQVIQYAGRVIQLAETIVGASFEPHFLDLLQKAKSNIREHRDGRLIYEKFVMPAVVDTEKLAAHYAISSLFDEYPDHAAIYCYTVEREEYQRLEAGRAALVVGRARFTSRITGESADETFGALSLGDHTISSGVGTEMDAEAYCTFVAQITEAFARVDFPEVIRALDHSFGTSIYSLKTLFRDEQRKILDTVLDATLAEDEASYRQIYDREAPLMRFVRCDLSDHLLLRKTTTEFRIGAAEHRSGGVAYKSTIARFLASFDYIRFHYGVLRGSCLPMPKGFC